MIGKRLAAVQTVCQRASVRLGERQGGRKKGLLIRPPKHTVPAHHTHKRGDRGGSAWTTEIICGLALFALSLSLPYY